MTANSAPYGHVCNYKTGEQLRVATHNEWIQSVLSDENGCFVDLVDGKTVVYVDGGPSALPPGHFVHDEGLGPQDDDETSTEPPEWYRVGVMGLAPVEPRTSTITNICKSPERAHNPYSISDLSAYGAANRPDGGEWSSEVRAFIQTKCGLSSALSLDPLRAATFAVDLLEAACFARGLYTNPTSGLRPVEPLPDALQERISKLEDLLANLRLAALAAEER